MGKCKAITITAVIGWLAAVVHADVLIVGGDAYPTIQAAIDAAAPGDEILIPPGTYTGPGNVDVDTLGKALTLRSFNPGDAAIVRDTVIDCAGTAAEPHRAFRCQSGEGPDTSIRGLTIINGYGPLTTFGEDTFSVGGAIMCRNGSSPIIADCVFENCFAEGGDVPGGSPPGYGGGAIYSRSSSPTIARCRFINNETDDDGGAVAYHGGQPAVIDNVFVGNHAADAGGAIYCRAICSPSIVNSLFNANDAIYGGGLFSRNGGTSTVINCTLVNNVAVGEEKGGGIRAVLDVNLVVTNSILWGNMAPEGTQIWVAYGATATVAYTDIEGGWVGGTSILDELPQFVEPLGSDGLAGTLDDDFSLDWASPCIDFGDNSVVVVDRDLAEHARILCGTVDLGAYESGYADADCDGDVDLVDFSIFAVCLAGPDNPHPAGCEIADLDVDNDVDLVNFAGFQVAFTGS